MFLILIQFLNMKSDLNSDCMRDFIIQRKNTKCMQIEAREIKILPYKNFDLIKSFKKNNTKKEKRKIISQFSL